MLPQPPGRLDRSCQRTHDQQEPQWCGRSELCDSACGNGYGRDAEFGVEYERLDFWAAVADDGVVVVCVVVFVIGGAIGAVDDFAGYNVVGWDIIGEECVFAYAYRERIEFGASGGGEYECCEF